MLTSKTQRVRTYHRAVSAVCGVLILFMLVFVMFFGFIKPATASVFHGCVYDSYSDEQQKLMIQSYELGKPYGFGYSLAAIAIVESSAGNNISNWREGSFGPYQNNATTVLNRHKVPSSDVILQFRTVERLIYDIEFAASEAIAELQYWYKVRNQDWVKTWASYNAGWRWENGLGYSTMINYHVVELQKCGIDAD